MLKKTAKLSKNELTKVAGGTLKETKELMNALSKDGVNTVFISNIQIGISAFLPTIEKALKEGYNIDADLSVGWGGTGFRETQNKYSINGKNISHQDVIAMIKAA